ncbi:hypothetical protein NUW54_g13133 [Trametes sanguinea]|uniref:Uncharacterized protein n=1 Tax=Trametes sanguinea TaxID=158606 RepID=A0ACC1MPS5_9APHY|nr:hypothetical protein NUW54_g13133 [Trametes sanguinea]
MTAQLVRHLDQIRPLAIRSLLHGDDVAPCASSNPDSVLCRLESRAKHPLDDVRAVHSDYRGFVKELVYIVTPSAMLSNCSFPAQGVRRRGLPTDRMCHHHTTPRYHSLPQQTVVEGRRRNGVYGRRWLAGVAEGEGRGLELLIDDACRAEFGRTANIRLRGTSAAIYMRRVAEPSLTKRSNEFVNDPRQNALLYSPTGHHTAVANGVE